MTSDTSLPDTSPDTAGKKPDTARVETINQVFALFRVNFHNQYYAAFSDTQLLNQTKKLWLESLSRFSPQQILEGARLAIEKSEYLPTLHRMIRYCQGDPADHGLPDAHQAYVEACHAGNPKAAHHWSHPAVYFAGHDTGWHWLATSAEQQAFPVFKQAYQHWCDRVLAGETLPDIEVPKIEQDTATPLSRTENKSRLDALRKDLDL